jgi:hypothetical protein
LIPIIPIGNINKILPVRSAESNATLLAPETTQRPAGLNAMLWTLPTWPRTDSSVLPVSMRAEVAARLAISVVSSRIGHEIFFR